MKHANMLLPTSLQNTTNIAAGWSCFLCALIKRSLLERHILCEFHRGTLARRTAGARSDYGADVLYFGPPLSTLVDVNKHVRTHARSHLLVSPLHKICVSSHQLSPFTSQASGWEEGAGGLLYPQLAAVLICWFSEYPPPLPFPSLYFLLPFLPLSVSVSSSASLPYVTQKGPQHTDEGESGLWADRPERKQGLLIGLQHCRHMKSGINPKQTFRYFLSINAICMQWQVWEPPLSHL